MVYTFRWKFYICFTDDDDDEEEEEEDEDMLVFLDYHCPAH
jgi:hypothetical protein